MPALQKEMQASSTSNFRYFTCLLDKGHIICGWCNKFVIQKNHLSAKIELFRLLFNERKGPGSSIYGYGKDCSETICAIAKCIKNRY